MDAHDGIGLARLRILEALFSGIKLPVIARHGELLHCSFIKPIIGQMRPIGRPLKCLCECKLLLIHPVAHPVDDGVLLTIRGDTVGLASGQMFHPDVIVLHIGHTV